MEGDGAAATQTPPGLPHEIELQILLKLPVKSVLRFGSVSKQWLSSTSDPKFMNSHHRGAKTRYDTILYKRSNGSLFSLGHDGCVEKFDGFVPNAKPSRYDDPRFVEYREILGSCDDSFVPNPKASDDASTFAEYLEILGSCNGLLFGITAYGEAYCWNPGTGKHVRVGCSEALQDRDGNSSITGLGYNSSTGDYKAVVAITSWVSPPVSPNPDSDDYCFVYLSVYILSFKTRAWKTVDYCPCFFSGGIGTVLDGNPHWALNSNASWANPNRFLIYFDVVDDHFKKLPPPPSTVTDSLILELGVLGGRELCVFITRTPDSSTSEVWAMKEYGVQESWVPLFDIPLFSVNLRPLCFTSSDKVLLTGNGIPRCVDPPDWGVIPPFADADLDEDGALFLYDPKADSTRKIMVPTNSGLGFSPAGYTAFALEDSLEWIGDPTSAEWTLCYSQSSNCDYIHESD